MQYQLISEDFKLTDSIKNHVEQNVEHLDSVVDSYNILHIFISEPRAKCFKVIFQLKYISKDLVVQKEGADLYKLVSQTRKLFENIIHEEKKRFLSKRHA